MSTKYSLTDSFHDIRAVINMFTIHFRSLKCSARMTNTYKCI